MRRFFVISKIRPGKRDEYFRRHRDIDPKVVAAGHEAGLRNYSMFLNGDTVYSYYEYIGSNYEEDMRKKNEKPEVKKWQSEMRQLLDVDSQQVFDEEWHNDF